MRSRLYPLSREGRFPIASRRDQQDHPCRRLVEQARQSGPLDDVAARCAGCLLLKLSHPVAGAASRWVTLFPYRFPAKMSEKDAAPATRKAAGAGAVSPSEPVVLLRGLGGGDRGR